MTLSSGEYSVVDKPLRLVRPIPVYILLAYSPARDETGIMAESWVAPYSRRPPGLAVIVEKSSYTLRIVLESRYYTLNIVDRDRLELAKYVGTHSGWEEDKIEKTRPPIAWLDLPPRIPFLEGSPGFLALRVVETVDLGPSILLKSRVEAAYARRDYVDESGSPDILAMEPMLHAMKHTFTRPCRGETWSVVRTRWGPAVKRPWRDKIP